LAAGLNNLSAVRSDQGNFSEAQQLSERSLAIIEEVRPDGIEVAASLEALARPQLRNGQSEGRS
jgi:hypothetical protein